MTQFNHKIKILKDMYDASYLEDYHTKLGLNVFSDHESLMQMKNICKLRLK